MRFYARFIAFTAAGCLTLSPAFADSKTPHGNKPSTPGKPTMSSPSPSGKSAPSSQTMNPIATKIASKPELNAKISAMLPTVKGKAMSLDEASMGFKNQGQFIAALHVAQNLNISFMDLKNAMVTKTGTGATAEFKQTSSLGQAIQTVKKNADSTTEVEKAEEQTHADLTTTTTTSSTKTPKNKKKTTTQTGGNQ
jgi:hypothetical protein